MSMSLQGSYVEILTLNMMVLEGGALERGLDHEDRALMRGISALIQEAPESSPALLPCEYTTRRQQSGRVCLVFSP